MENIIILGEVSRKNLNDTLNQIGEGLSKGTPKNTVNGYKINYPKRSIDYRE